MALPWRVANTRDEAAGGPLARALEDEGLLVVPCPVLQEAEVPEADRLRAIATTIAEYDWVVMSSARSVRALQSAGVTRWPAHVRAATVGATTARALVALGASPPLVGDDEGADALWTALLPADAWPRRRVLVATTDGGRTLLQERLREAGADVDVLEVYRMTPRPAAAILDDWSRAEAHAVVLTSARAATVLVEAIGTGALAHLEAVVAIGSSTAEALRAMGLRVHVPGRAQFAATAALVAELARKVDR